MNICFLINHLGGGGAERALQSLANYYCQHGHTVTIFTLENREPAYRFDPKIQVRQVLPIQAGGIIRDLVLPIQAISAARLIRRLKPDFVLSFLQRSNFVNILSGLFGGGARVCISEQIATDSAFDSDTLYGGITLRLVRWLYPRASKIFCASEGVRDSLVRLGVDCSSASIVPNPVDGQEVLDSKGEPIGELDGRPVIVTLGRLAHQKNHRCLIDACAPLLKDFDARLLIIGEGTLEQELRSQAVALGVGDKVLFYGWCSNPYALLKASTIFALSSRFEGFGNVLVEAMACGLPVVSTDCPSGPAEILGNGEFGILTPNEDAVSLREQIKVLLLDVATRQHFIQQSLLRAQDYMVATVAQTYLSELRGLESAGAGACL